MARGNQTQTWGPDQRSLNTHSEAYGYAMGIHQWGQHRLQSSNAIVGDILEALGESWDQEMLDQAIIAFIGGYVKAYKTFRFPSKTLERKQWQAPDNSAVLMEMLRIAPKDALLIKALFTPIDHRDPNATEQEGEETEVPTEQ